ncbi:MAG: FG-GAP repeat protein [Planctomycetota bacterium]|jgi:hypothetical protein
MFENSKTEKLSQVVLAIVVCMAAVDLGLADWQEEAKLTASDGAANDWFGVSVSVSSPYYLIGADGDDDNGNWSGAAYMFKRDGTTWAEQIKLHASNGTAGDRFGLRVSISGDCAIVGAPYADPHGERSGSAYIFKRYSEGWVEQAEITAFDGAPYDYFGHFVCISADYAIVAAPEDDIDGLMNAGSAYIFKHDGESWVQQAKLIASDRAAYDRFGASVSVDGHYAIVGAVYKDSNGNADAGAAYVFKRNGESWTQEAKLTASDGIAEDHFGNSASIRGDCAVVGAPGGDSRTVPGAAYIFKRNGENWIEQEPKLTASDGVAGDVFGAGVQTNGDYTVVSAVWDDDFTGSAYVFKRHGEGWTEQGKLIASDRAPHDQFGPCAISGNHVVVGSGGDDDHGNGSGSAHVFVLDPIIVDIDIDPDTLNLSSKGKWVTCYIELPQDFDVIDIKGETVELDGIPAHIGEEGWARAGANSSNIMDHDGDGIPERMVKFDRSAVQGLLVELDLLGNVDLIVSGELIDGPSFEGTDVMRVINEGKKTE